MPPQAFGSEALEQLPLARSCSLTLSVYEFGRHLLNCPSVLIVATSDSNLVAIKLLNSEEIAEIPTWLTCDPRGSLAPHRETQVATPVRPKPLGITLPVGVLGGWPLFQSHLGVRDGFPGENGVVGNICLEGDRSLSCFYSAIVLLVSELKRGLRPRLPGRAAASLVAGWARPPTGS